MNTRIRFNLRGKNNADVKIGTDKTIVEIGELVSHGGFLYAHAQRENDNEDLDGKSAADGSTNGTKHTIRISNNDGENVATSDLRHVHIKCADEGQAILLRNILLLKRAEADAAGRDWNFWIKNWKYDENKPYAAGDDSTFANITDAGGVKTLNLNVADFGNSLANVVIDDVNFNDPTPGDRTNVVAGGDFSAQRNELAKLHALLLKLDGRYGSVGARIDSVDETNEGGENNIDYLKTFGSTVAGVVTAGKKRIYELSDGTNNVYEGQIKNYQCLLPEFAVWKLPEIGFTTIDQILKANANGLTIVQRGAGTTGVTIAEAGKHGQLDDPANLAHIKSVFAGGKYKGEEICDPNQTIELTNAWTTGTAPTDTFRIINGMAAYEGREWYHRLAIDAFRGNDWFDDPKYKDKTSANQLRGFLMSDFKKNGYSKNNPSNHGAKLKGTAVWSVASDFTTETEQTDRITRLVFDIWYAPNIDAAIDLAFFGRHFHKDDDTPSKHIAGDDRYDTSKSGCLLFFNEVAGLSKKDHVEIYYDALKSAECGNHTTDLCYNPTSDEYDGANWKANNLKTNAGNASTDPRTKAKAAYDAVIKFLGYCEEYKAADKNNATKKSTWESNKVKLQEYKAKGTGWTVKVTGDWDERIGKYFAWKIDKLITHNDNVFKVSDDDNNDKFSKENIAELAKLAAGEGETNAKAKAVYVEFQKLAADSDEKTNGVYTQLKEIIAKLKEISHDKPGDLEKLGQTGDGKTAWDFIDKVEEAKDNNIGWAKSVLDKAKGELTAAITAAETEMSGEGDAVNKTTIKSVESIAEAKAIKELFALCKKAHGSLTSTELPDLITNLKGFKNSGDVAKKAAWDKVNKYTKSGEDKPFAEFSLDKVDKNNNNNKNDFAEYLKMELDKIWPQYQKDKTAKKTSLEDNDIRRVMAAVCLKDGDANEKKLSQIFSKASLSDYADDKSNIAKSLTDIENDINELKKYINAKDSDPEGVIRAKLTAVANFGNAKTFLENWVSKLEDRKATLKAKSEEYKKNQDDGGDKGKPTNEPSFWTGPWGITIICVGVVAVLGAIAYFIKSNSSEEGEGE